MKKLFFLLAMCLLMAACSSQPDEPQMAELPETDGQSDYLTPTEACEIASDAFDNFFKGTADATPSSRSARSAYAHFYQSDALSRSQSPSLYVVDFEEGGFAVVNAHRNASTQIYAVVEKGQFDDSDNPGLKYYMAYAEERAAADYVKRANSSRGIGVLPPLEIKKDKLINSDVCLRKGRSEWDRRAPYNNKCAFMPNSTERYPVSTLAVSLGSLVADIKYRNGNLKTESFRDGKVYTFHWDEMLEFSTIDYLTEVGQEDICTLLDYFNSFDTSYLNEKGDFISHELVPEAIQNIIGLSHWFTTPTIFKHGTTIEDIYNNILAIGTAQLMYAEEADKTVGDVWLVEGAKIDTYQRDSPSIDGSVPGEIYDMPYLYFNWCLGGRSNGWYYYSTVWIEYYNNDESTGKDDPNIIGECYTKNILSILDVEFKN